MKCTGSAPLLAFGALLAAPPANAQDANGPTQQIEEMSDKAEATHSDKGDDKFSLLVVPIPQVNPTLGKGLTLVGVGFYNPNHSREPWVTGAGAMYTSNGSRMIGALHKMSLARDKFQVVVFGGYAKINMDFYGIGPNAGDRDLSIELQEKGYLALGQGQMRLAKDFYVGPRIMYLNLNSSIHRDEPLFPDAELPKPQFNTTTLAIGPTVSYDTRKNSFNPTGGEYVTAAWMFNSKDLGSDFTYNKFTAQANLYRTVAKGSVIAAHVSICGTSTGGPFYDICMYGSGNDLRGYETGRYRDRASWAAQVELRQHLFGKFGAAAFAGVGGIAPSLSKLGDTKLLPAAGVGLRFRANKATGINLRLDYAIGRDSNAVYFSIGEAF